MEMHPGFYGIPGVFMVISGSSHGANSVLIGCPFAAKCAGSDFAPRGQTRRSGASLFRPGVLIFLSPTLRHKGIRTFPHMFGL